jgi:hypothetical protein
MSFSEQLVFSGPAISAGGGHSLTPGRLAAWSCALGLILCLLGCHPKVNNPPALPAPAAAAPRPRMVRPTFYVTVNQLRLRACPGLDCPKTSTLEMNTEVEKMGVIDTWTQIKVKKDGTLGYVSSRFLSPHPVEVAKLGKKKRRKAKQHQATQPQEMAGKEATPDKQEPSPPFPRVM